MQQLRALLVDARSDVRDTVARRLRETGGPSVDTVSRLPQATARVRRAAGARRPYHVALVGHVGSAGASAAALDGLAVDVAVSSPDTKLIRVGNADADLYTGIILGLAGHGPGGPASQVARGQADSHARTLLGISSAVNSSLDLPETLEAVCKGAVELLDVSHSALVLFAADLTHGIVRAEHPALGATGRRIPLLGVTAEEQLIATRQPLVVEDVAAAEELGPVQQTLLDLNIRSTLIVPVAGRRGLLGSFSFDAVGYLRTYTRAHVELSQALAAQVAVAIDNAQLFGETRARADQAESLRRAALDIATLADLDHTLILDRVLEDAVAALGARSGGVYSYAPDRRELTLAADYRPADGPQPGNRRTVLKIGEGMAGRLVQTGAPYMVVDDYGGWAERAPAFPETSFGAVLEVPVRWRERVIGVLYVDDDVGRQFTAAHASLLGPFADQAAIALARAAHDPSTPAPTPGQPASGEGLLYAATKDLLSDLGITPLDARFTRIAKYATEILDAETCQVLLRRRAGWLTLEASFGHVENTFEKGREFEIRSGPGAGLTGHIAHEGGLFRAHGRALTEHVAVRGLEPTHVPAGQCYSLLALPLFRSAGDGQELLGLLRVENKRGPQGHSALDVGFTDDDERNIVLFADAVVTAIEHEELVTRLRRQADVDARRKKLSTAFFDARRLLRAEKDPVSLQNEVVRQAAELLGYSAAFMYDNEPGPRQLLLLATFGVSRATGETVPGAREPYPAGLAGYVAETGQPLTLTEDKDVGRARTVAGHQFRTVLGVPLKRAGSGVGKVLMVADVDDGHPFLDVDLEILTHFAEYAAHLFQTSRMRRWERDVYNRAAALGRITDYMRRAPDPDRVLAALLTGVTAEYGLRFNRAVALLFDDDRSHLTGRIAIGHLTAAAAQRGWKRFYDSHMDDVVRYLKRLERRGHVGGQLQARLRAAQLPTRPTMPTLFRHAVEQGHLLLDEPARLAEVPTELRAALGPTTPLVVVPLVHGEQVLGFVLADNRFTKTEVHPENVDPMLLSLTRAAAAALAAAEFPATPDTAADYADLHVIRQGLVSNAMDIFGGDSAILWLRDAARHTYVLAECAGAVPARLRAHMNRRPPRPGGTAFKVSKDGWVGVEDVVDERRYGYIRSGTRAILRSIGARSFQGMNLGVGGEQLGVLYVNYREPRAFTEDNRDAAVAFASDAALVLRKAQMLHHVQRARNTARAVARLSTLDDLNATLKSVVDETRDTLDCDAVTLFPYGPRGQLHSPPHASGVWDEAGLLQEREVPEESIVWSVLRGSRRVIENVPASDFGPTGFARREQIASCVAMPLLVGSVRVGVMFVNHRTPHHFTSDDLTDIQLFADQAAVAIHSAQLYQQVEQRRRAFEASYKASLAVMGSSELKHILAGIAEQAFHLAGVGGRQARFASVTLDCEGGSHMIAAYPPDLLPLLRGVQERARRHPGAPWPGIVGRAMTTGTTQWVRDVAGDPDYLVVPGHPVSSALAIPIKAGSRTIGALNVEHADREAFDQLDEPALAALAANVTLASEKVAHIAREQAALSLAGLQLVQRNWQHNAGRFADNLRAKVMLAKDALDRGARSGNVTGMANKELRKWLALIEGMAPTIEQERIQMMPWEDKERVAVNQLLRDLRPSPPRREEFGSQVPPLDLRTSEEDAVWGNRKWLLEALVPLIDNALVAMRRAERRALTVTSRRVGAEIEVDVSDSGCGLPPEMRESFPGRVKQKRSGEEGLGIGLLMTQIAALHYDGRLTLVGTRPEQDGTTIRLSLPAADSNP